MLFTTLLHGFCSLVYSNCSCRMCLFVPVNKSMFTLQDQLGRVALLSGFLFIMLGFGADGAPSLVQTRTPPPSVLGIPNIPCSTSGYSYTIFKLGPLQFTRKGLSVASTSASLSFAVRPSLNLQVFQAHILWLNPSLSYTFLCLLFTSNKPHLMESTLFVIPLGY